MTEPKGRDPATLANHIVDRSMSPDEWSGEHCTVPLGSSRNGSLRFTNGAHRVSIRADLDTRGLYHARFEDRTPTVEVRRGVVTIRFPGFPTSDWLDCRSERPPEISLNALIPWDVEVSGSVSRLLADLRGLQLGSLNLEGGASRLEVVLPSPSGNVAVVILGGASNVAIRLPEGVATRLRVEGGTTNLTFDDRHIGATGGELDLRSWNYDTATDRYDIVITGGANNVSIDKTARTEGADRDREAE
jgi:hypothetical protein